jgi:hypothetical protein
LVEVGGRAAEGLDAREARIVNRYLYKAIDWLTIPIAALLYGAVIYWGYPYIERFFQ